jgi:tetratricopeptide (TPR) repeat protein
MYFPASLGPSRVACTPFCAYPLPKLVPFRLICISVPYFCTSVPILLQVLQDDPNNAKALFRRAQAYTMTNDFEEAERDFREMQNLDPTTEADAKAGLAKVRRREQVRTESCKSAF